MMRIAYDSEANAAYIYIQNSIAPGEVANTYMCDPSEVNGQINLDFNKQGKLLGIEVLDAKQKLDATLLAQASRT